MSILDKIDWTMVHFVGTTLVTEYWFHVRLPQIQYWEMVKRSVNEQIVSDTYKK